MVPAVQALLVVALACLLAPLPVGSVPACAFAWERDSVSGRAWAADPGAVVEALPSFRDEAGGGLADEEDEPHPVRPRPASAPAAFVPVVALAGAGGASAHPAFHAVARSRFLLCGRLTC